MVSQPEQGKKMPVEKLLAEAKTYRDSMALPGTCETQFVQLDGDRSFQHRSFGNLSSAQYRFAHMSAFEKKRRVKPGES